MKRRRLVCRLARDGRAASRTSAHELLVRDNPAVFRSWTAQPFGPDGVTKLAMGEQMREVLAVLVISVALLPRHAIAARPEIWIGYATLEKIGSNPPQDDRLRQPQRVRLKFRPGANGKMTCPHCFSVCRR